MRRASMPAQCSDKVRIKYPGLTYPGQKNCHPDQARPQRLVHKKNGDGYANSKIKIRNEESYE